MKNSGKTAFSDKVDRSIDCTIFFNVHRLLLWLLSCLCRDECSLQQGLRVRVLLRVEQQVHRGRGGRERHRIAVARQARPLGDRARVPIIRRHRSCVGLFAVAILGLSSQNSELKHGRAKTNGQDQ